MSQSSGFPIVALPAEQVGRISELQYVIPLDLETSGLDEHDDQVLELYCRFGGIVDGQFVPKPTESEKHHVFPLMSNIEDWHPEVLKMHSANGLIPECVALRKSLRGLSATSAYLNDVDQALAKRAQYLLPPKTKWTLLGNSVHFDLRFLRRHLPEFSKHLSHRVIDCSAIRLFCEALGRPYVKSDPAHRAKDDVEESIKLFYDCRDWVASTAFAVGAFNAKAAE